MPRAPIAHPAQAARERFPLGRARVPLEEEGRSLLAVAPDREVALLLPRAGSVQPEAASFHHQLEAEEVVAPFLPEVVEEAMSRLAVAVLEARQATRRPAVRVEQRASLPLEVLEPLTVAARRVTAALRPALAEAPALA